MLVWTILPLLVKPVLLSVPRVLLNKCLYIGGYKLVFVEENRKIFKQLIVTL